MTVGDMKKLIEGVPDDVQFFEICGDHEARRVAASDGFVVADGRPFSQFFGDEFLMEGETKVRAIVIE